jgi:hypothetical protein
MMQRAPLALRIWRWIRAYVVALLLLFALAASCVRTLTHEVGPRPQHPPSGYVLTRTRVQIQWSAGNTGDEIRLQLATDEGFGDPIVDEVVSGKTRELKDLEPGGVYFWRLNRGGRIGETASFEVSPTALRYR